MFNPWENPERLRKNCVEPRPARPFLAASTKLLISSYPSDFAAPQYDFSTSWTARNPRHFYNSRLPGCNRYGHVWDLPSPQLVDERRRRTAAPSRDDNNKTSFEAYRRRCRDRRAGFQSAPCAGFKI